MRYWLLKSEPFKYGWDRLVAEGRTHWDGVRNHQAAANLKAMRVGDRAFFYHSNEGLAVVGVVEIARAAHPDPGDPAGRFVMVDVRPLGAVARPVSLKEIKADPLLADMALVRQSRLSVCPVTPEQWQRVLKLAGGMTRQRLCALSDIPDGQARGFEPFGGRATGTILARRGAAVFAYRDACPHSGSRLNRSPDRLMAPDGIHLMCANHAALFRVEDGYCVRGPCAGDRLRPLGSAVEDGQVLVWED